jgi:hypothetical protein
MKAWRMSLRAGNHGREMWPDCVRWGVAAITYRPLATIDLSKFAQGEPQNLWDELEPSQKASLRRVAYEMAAGDVIYVKQGPKTVDKGIVSGRYEFDSQSRLIGPDDVRLSATSPMEAVEVSSRRDSARISTVCDDCPGSRVTLTANWSLTRMGIPDCV